MINWSYILMSERNLWRYLQRNLKDNKSLLMRVENSLYKGIPDVNYLIDGNEGWIELKYMPEYPKKDITEVKVPHFTKEQKIWHDIRYKNKGRTMVLIQVDRDYFIFKKERINLLGSLTKKKMFQYANKSWKNKIDFKELRKELCA
tara:strand:- start:1659 stop:2096 length:438 start_codon:yes stop_codon:yes gene_type:complete